MKEAERSKLNRMYSIVSGKRYAWHENVNGDVSAHDQKSDLWRTLQDLMEEAGGESLIFSEVRDYEKNPLNMWM